MPIIDEEFLSRLSSVEREPVIRYATEDEEKAFDKIRRLVSVRERCQRELLDRLVRDGFSKEDADEAVRRATACGLVDDARYAGVLIRSRLSQGKGVSGICAELERSGIDISQVPGWPEDFLEDAPSEVDRALALLRRKPPHAKDVRGAAFRRLVGKGFSQQAAYDAARRFAEEVHASVQSEESF